ncbi:MAG: ATP-dependent DNA helicase RecG [Firmicutes bacterium]|nr:ATP-dependent DNA helicase RecG [Bacillota bacterium]
MLDAPVQRLPGVGKARAMALSRLEIETLGDLLTHAPRDYEDWCPRPIAEVTDGESVCVRGTVEDIRQQRFRGSRGLVVSKAALQDSTGSIELVWFRRGRYGAKGNQVKRGQNITVYGSVRRDQGTLVMHNPEIASQTVPRDAQLIPVYPLTEGVSQRLMRSWIQTAIKVCWDSIEEYLGISHIEQLGLLGRREAFKGLHRPKSYAHAMASRARLVFDELLCYQIAILSARYRQQHRIGKSHGPDGPLVSQLMESLPFSLTDGQRQAMAEVAADMESTRPMGRLLQGDVGSGKTIVAIYGLAKTVEAGYQGVVMAPTEILAQQHFAQITSLFASQGIEVRLLTGGLSNHEKADVCRRLQDGTVQVVVGTQALLEPDVRFANLGLVVVDEEHRLGVLQRQALAKKGSGDLLVMTATPIPRTLALSLYGDLDMSLIKELPLGRLPVDTRWISPQDRDKVYGFLRDQVKRGHQAYIVYPLVEGEETTKLAAAKTEAYRLRKLPVFADVRIGLLHGQMSSQEKTSVIEEFSQGHWQILVTTSVIEVGIDVPNATVMVIEHAERFGLAQLHQLRGRVGRGTAQSFCLLMGEPTTPEARERLEFMRETQDGFVLAEADLRLRGPGEILGVKQTGLPNLRMADLRHDGGIMDKARHVANQILGDDLFLSQTRHKPLVRELGRRGVVSRKHDGGLY